MVNIEGYMRGPTSSRLTARPSVPTTQQFAALHDHARLPSRFWGRFTTTLGTLG